MKRLLICALCALSVIACQKPQQNLSDSQLINMVSESMMQLVEPSIYSIENIEILTRRVQQPTQIEAELVITLRFPRDFESVVTERKLKPYNIEYLQFEQSFGKFATNEKQNHYAVYHFKREQDVWRISKTQKLTPPSNTAADSNPPATQ